MEAQSETWWHLQCFGEEGLRYFGHTTGTATGVKTHTMPLGD